MKIQIEEDQVISLNRDKDGIVNVEKKHYLLFEPSENIVGQFGIRKGQAVVINFNRAISDKQAMIVEVSFKIEKK